MASDAQTVLAAHVYASGSDGRGCTCGWRRSSGDMRPLREQWADLHLAAVLEAEVIRPREQKAWETGRQAFQTLNPFADEGGEDRG